MYLNRHPNDLAYDTRHDYEAPERVVMANLISGEKYFWNGSTFSDDEDEAEHFSPYSRFLTEVIKHSNESNYKFIRIFIERFDGEEWSE